MRDMQKCFFDGAIEWCSQGCVFEHKSIIYSTIVFFPQKEIFDVCGSPSNCVQ